MPTRTTDKIIKRGNRIMGRKTPKKATVTTSLVMDSDDMQTLRTVAHLRVANGTADAASVSEMVRAAVREYIERHGLTAEEYAVNNKIGPH